MNNGPRIVFMGTPEFAVSSLGALLINNYNVVAVVTAPDKPAGRGRKVSQSAVARYAKENCLNLLQPENLKDKTFIRNMVNLAPDIAVVVAFRMLPEAVWKIPRIGTFNLHASLLPQYRGAAPINHVLINGETVTGITTFLIDEKIDTGNILYRKELKISHTENAGELHDRLMRSGAKLVVKTVKMLAEGKVKPVGQDKFTSSNEVLKTAPKIFPSDCFINWADKGENIHNLVRGLSPYPGARTYFNKGDKKILVKILEGQHHKIDNAVKPGIISSEKNKLYISTRDGNFELLIIQPEGKKAMTVTEYLRGTDPCSLSISTSHQV
jgi:methionyl-tRNA formyltransferase